MVTDQLIGIFMHSCPSYASYSQYSSIVGDHHLLAVETVGLLSVTNKCSYVFKL